MAPLSWILIFSNFIRHSSVVSFSWDLKQLPMDTSGSSSYLAKNFLLLLFLTCIEKSLVTENSILRPGKLAYKPAVLGIL